MDENMKNNKLTDKLLEKVCGGEDDFDPIITTAGEPDSRIWF